MRVWAQGIGQLIRAYMASHDPDILSLFRHELSEKLVDVTELFWIQWESRLNQTGELLPDLAIQECEEGLIDVYSAIDYLLAEEMRSSLYPHSRKRVQHGCLRKHVILVKTFAEVIAASYLSSQAIYMFTEKAGPIHPALQAKYRQERIVFIEIALQWKKKLESFHVENKELIFRLKEAAGEADITRHSVEGRWWSGGCNRGRSNLALNLSDYKHRQVSPTGY